VLPDCEEDRGVTDVSYVRTCAPAEGKAEDALGKEARAQVKAEGIGDGFDASSEKSLKSKTLTIANPMNTINKMTSATRGNDSCPLYFPGAKSAALKRHSGVKFIVYRVDSPEDLSDPITIQIKLNLAEKTLRTSNPAAASQRMSRKYYHFRAVDIDLWEHDGKFGISLVERQTSCFCFHSGVERDYVFSTEEDRSHFCSLIHAIDDEVLPAGSIPEIDESTPRAPSKPVRLFVTTWNQGDTEPSKNLAGDWLPNDGSVDIFVVGTQESPLGTDSTGLTGAAGNKWFKMLEKSVGDDYVAVATRSMFQNFLWVATKKEHAQKFSGVETYQAEQGIGKIWGNKGGTAVALRFNGHKLAFVNTHLAAHAEKWEKRNEDIQAIVGAVHFGNYSEVEFVNQYTTFWLGDLNYRVEMDREEATQLAESGDFTKLFENEQLKREMGKGILDGFIEGEITFRPTYKMDPLPVSASAPRKPRPFSAHKDRTPSWTDRVLMRPMPGASVEQIAYDSAWKVTSSDHDPVFATYDFSAPEIPKTGNYRRFLLILSGLEICDLTQAGPGMSITINFPFLDDIKKGIKFKHQVRLHLSLPHFFASRAKRSLLLLACCLTCLDNFVRHRFPCNHCPTSQARTRTQAHSS
jgi:endonuclease/exonuclease/phosphatase family metal-dependent hydrolase